MCMYACVGCVYIPITPVMLKDAVKISIRTPRYTVGTSLQSLSALEPCNQGSGHQQIIFD